MLFLLGALRAVRDADALQVEGLVNDPAGRPPDVIADATHSAPMLAGQLFAEPNAEERRAKPIENSDAAALPRQLIEATGVKNKKKGETAEKKPKTVLTLTTSARDWKGNSEDDNRLHK